MWMLRVIGFLLGVISVIFLICVIAFLVCTVGEVLEFAVGKKDGFFKRAKMAMRNL